MTALKIQGLSKWFGKTLALEAIDLQIDARQRLVIVGQSGAGKTTLLRVLAGLEKANHGEIAIDGRDMTACASNHRGVALVTQDYALYPQLTVRQNLETALNSLKLQRAERNARIDDVLSWFQIVDLQQRLPSQVSGGQAQRVALAKAMVRQPRLLLLDEPLSQIDCVLREDMRQLIHQTVDRFSTSLVMVTHDPLDAMRLADCIAIMEAGRLVQVGLPEEIYASPSCRAAADLLSPFGVNWLTLTDLPNDAASELERVLAQPLAGKMVGFRPESGLLMGPDENPAVPDTCVLPIELLRCQSLGFADLAVLKCGQQQLTCLGNAVRQAKPAGLRVSRQDLFVFAAELS